MCILELSKALIYEFNYDYIKDEYDNDSKLLLTDTDSLMYEIKTEDVYGDFSIDKEMFDFSNSSSESKYYHNWDKLVIGKVNDKTRDVAIKEFVGLKPKMYSSLVDDNSENEKAIGMNRNVVATVTHNEYTDFECLRHSINKIQSKYHKIGTYEINKISLSCSDNKIYI